jgi:excisionase family DNA binding protein
MDEEYFTVAEVAEKLKVTPQAVYKWIKQKKITVIYAGADARITSSEIEAFIKRSTESRLGSDSDKMGAQITAPGQAAFDLATA